MVTEMQKTGAEALTNEQVARFLALLDLAKIVGKAAQKTADNRIMAGSRVEGFKLVKAKANRAWKETSEVDGAAVRVEDAAKAEFGSQAFSAPTLLSPAGIDELPLGAAFTARWAAKPETGLTLAPASDPRKEVSVDTKSLFTDVTKKAAPAPVETGYFDKERPGQ